MAIFNFNGLGLLRCALILELAAVLSVTPSHACLGDRSAEQIPVYSFTFEMLKPARPDQPAQRELVIGSIFNLAVPKGTKVTITSLAKGSMDPVQALDDDTYTRIGRRRLDEREPFPVAPNLEKVEIKRFYVGSFGKAQIDFQANGENRRMVVGAIYQAPTPQGRPVLLLDSDADVPTFQRNLREQGLWFKVPGKVSDGWELQHGSDRGFSILRIEQLEVPYDDPPAVGIFLYGSSAMKSGEMALVSGSTPNRQSYRFKVLITQVTAC